MTNSNLPLDPHPLEQLIGGPITFNPRPGYSQNEEDYQ